MRSTTIAIEFCGGGWLTAVVVASANASTASPPSSNETCHWVTPLPPKTAVAFVMSLPLITVGPRRNLFFWASM